ncbi:uncharacterized protein PAC_08952 [Phialocephala subalpina]|uniref:Uncharacterized protein n=1 Tax=Phialocephala subalpina TaxID=576137 RepID=A0A1L7X215_9HELO|nr:uncharacterized protein PAC_08952 [Phialocephala subalpina]
MKPGHWKGTFALHVSAELGLGSRRQPPEFAHLSRYNGIATGTFPEIGKFRDTSIRELVDVSGPLRVLKIAVSEKGNAGAPLQKLSRVDLNGYAEDYCYLSIKEFLPFLKLDFITTASAHRLKDERDDMDGDYLGTEEFGPIIGQGLLSSIHCLKELVLSDSSDVTRWDGLDGHSDWKAVGPLTSLKKLRSHRSGCYVSRGLYEDMGEYNDDGSIPKSLVQLVITECSPAIFDCMTELLFGNTPPQLKTAELMFKDGSPMSPHHKYASYWENQAKEKGILLTDDDYRIGKSRARGGASKSGPEFYQPKSSGVQGSDDAAGSCPTGYFQDHDRALSRRPSIQCTLTGASTNKLGDSALDPLRLSFYSDGDSWTKAFSIRSLSPHSTSIYSIAVIWPIPNSFPRMVWGEVARILGRVGDWAGGFDGRSWYE